MVYIFVCSGCGRVYRIEFPYGIVICCGKRYVYDEKVNIYREERL